MRTWVTVLAVGAVAVVGCASIPQMTAVDLAARAQQNLLEAQQKLAGRQMIVRGVVKETTLASREHRELQPAWNGSPATSVTKEEQLPLVVLQPGSVLCYFEPADIGDAVKLREGDSVAFDCEVQSFKEMGPMTVATLAGCRRAK